MLLEASPLAQLQPMQMSSKKACPCLKEEPPPPPPPPPPPRRPAEDSSKKTLEVQMTLFIQTWWRGMLVRRTLLFATLCALGIQRWWRQRAYQLKEERRVRALLMYVWPEKSTVLLQSKFRMWLMKTQYKKCQKAAQVIQNNWRHFIYQREFSSYSLSSLAYDGIDLNVDIVVE
ncbi:IQ domain-containing protein F6 [Python bivittatus]|uniref:IQ domain-containing protein F6 n=1 Tax=Python bivittatus TaxID=176946 RepID=A0A9F5MVT1_PYTBI|nr:IQ domain-containing protein F6 [Python bivittatus]